MVNYWLVLSPWGLNLPEPGGGDRELLAGVPRSHLQRPHQVALLIFLQPLAGCAERDGVPLPVDLVRTSQKRSF